MATPAKKKRPVTGWQRGLVVRLDKWIYSFSRHWLAVFNVLVGIYVGLPILAPVLMNSGATGPAKLIYAVYSPMCHQMASRSFFLFGEQVAYPRQIAGTNLTPIESYTPDIPEFAGVAPVNWAQFWASAREFVGNGRMGYKMALCERDMGIYAFVLIGGLAYAFLRRFTSVKPLPIWVFLLIGIGPIALDGFSQLFSHFFTPLDGSVPTGLQGTLHNWLALRESTPFLRVFTGGLFGFMLVWLAYPHVDVGMRGTANDLERKLTRIGEMP